MSKDKVYFLLPCFNEEENIEDLIYDCIKEGNFIQDYYFKILVVNDGSFDKTKLIVDKIRETHSEVEILNNEENMGLGYTLNRGINYCLKDKECKLVCVMDGDNTHDPKYVHAMIKTMNEKRVGCVIASRYEEGSKIIGLSKYRILLSIGARKVYESLIKVENVKDYTCGYRLYNIEFLDKLKNSCGKDIIVERGFSATGEILIKLNEIGCNFAEIPFELKYYKKGGKSKMEVFKTIKGSIKLIMKLRRERRVYEEVHKDI